MHAATVRPVEADSGLGSVNYWPLCVICTILSRTVILPVRAEATALGAMVKETGLSPACGIDVVIVIQGTSACAVHLQRSCVALPQVIGSLVWMTLN
jgi:hypothetical protein